MLAFSYKFTKAIFTSYLLQDGSSGDSVQVTFAYQQLEVDYFVPNSSGSPPVTYIIEKRQVADYVRAPRGAKVISSPHMRRGVGHVYGISAKTAAVSVAALCMAAASPVFSHVASASSRGDR